MTSVAKVREMPYFTSSAVTGLPSCHLRPSLSVNFHVLPLSVTVPVSVAMSPTSLGTSVSEVVAVHVVRVRVNRRLPASMFTPTYTRWGSQCSVCVLIRMFSVPPLTAAAAADVDEPDVAVLLHAAAERARPAGPATPATNVLRFRRRSPLC